MVLINFLSILKPLDYIMTIVKYNVIDPAIDKHKPYYDVKKKLFIFPVKQRYSYFVQAYQINSVTNIKEYLLLLGKEKFDESCRRCQVNQYGKCNMRITDEFLEYVKGECAERGNIEIEYLESENNYDVYIVR